MKQCLARRSENVVHLMKISRSLNFRFRFKCNAKTQVHFAGRMHIPVPYSAWWWRTRRLHHHEQFFVSRNRSPQYCPTSSVLVTSWVLYASRRPCLRVILHLISCKLKCVFILTSVHLKQIDSWSVQNYLCQWAILSQCRCEVKNYWRLPVCLVSFCDVAL